MYHCQSLQSRDAFTNVQTVYGKTQKPLFTFKNNKIRLDFAWKQKAIYYCAIRFFAKIKPR